MIEHGADDEPAAGRDEEEGIGVSAVLIGLARPWPLFMPVLVPLLRAEGEITVIDAQAELLVQISAATIDRMLAGSSRPSQKPSPPHAPTQPKKTHEATRPILAGPRASRIGHARTSTKT